MKVRIIKRTGVDESVRYVIQKRYLTFFWRDERHGSFFTLDDAKKCFYRYYSGRKVKEEVIQLFIINQ